MTSLPTSIENFITDEENKILLNTAQNKDQLFNLARDPGQRWDKRCLHLNWLYTKENYDVHQLVVNFGLKLQNKIREIENNEEFSALVPMIVRWFPGDCIDPPHADNLRLDGTPAPGYRKWVTHGSVLYLNNDFEGGNFYYQHHDIVVHPQPKLLILHRAGAEDLHGVHKVTKGIRYTLACFASDVVNSEIYTLDKYIKTHK